MLPKKLFTPKCLHPDRDIVFQADLNSFYDYVVKDLVKKAPNLPVEDNDVYENNLLLNFTFSHYKSLYSSYGISMLHFSRSKEENAKEFYEVLFGEVQLFIFTPSLLKQIFSIYTLYSLYFTQISQRYQINTIPEYLKSANELIKKLEKNNKQIAYTLYVLMKKLNEDSAFSVGVILGLKSILLNKYGLPVEQKTNVYNDYIDITKYKAVIDSDKKEEENLSTDEVKDLNIEEDYMSVKREIAESIKNLAMNDEIDKSSYVQYINSVVDEDEKITESDLGTNNVTNFDCLFNKLI